MKIVFFGTPEYVLPILKAVHKKFVTGPGKSPIVAVVTQPPKPVGRKQILTYSAIDKWAHEHKIPIYYSSKELLEDGPEVELGILASYGEIIGKDVINMFPQGIIVVHPSLLPKYRGASPIPESIKNGDKTVGVTFLRMDEKMDHGPIIAQFKDEVQPGEDAGQLRNRLFERSADVMVETLEPYIKGKIKPRPQDHDQATFTKILTKQDGFIELKGLSLEKAETVDNFIRAMSPWPGAWTILPNEKRLKLLKSHLDESGKLILDEVQLEGKEPVSFKQFTQAYPNLIPRS